MGKKNIPKKFLLPILILLSASSISSILFSEEIVDYKKIMLICMNLIYLFFVSEYIFCIIHDGIFISSLKYKRVFPDRNGYILCFILLPIISLLIYVFAWTIYSSYPVFDRYTFLILMLMSISCFFPFFDLEKSMIMVNDESMLIGYRLIRFELISKCEVLEKKYKALRFTEGILYLKNGEKIPIKSNDEFLRELSKKQMN